MPGSLQDQLIKAGLATADQAKKASKQQRTEKKKQRHARKKGSDEKTASDTRRDQARDALAQKKRADRNRGRQDAAQAGEKALRAELRHMILSHDVRIREKADSDEPYNFVHGSKIKRLYVNAGQKAELISGKLAIVNNDGLYYFVPAAIAAKIAERDPKRVILANTDAKPDPATDGAGTDDDAAYYAKFEVPDDLDW